MPYSLSSASRIYCRNMTTVEERSCVVVAKTNMIDRRSASLNLVGKFLDRFLRIFSSQVKNLQRTRVSTQKIGDQSRGSKRMSIYLIVWNDKRGTLYAPKHFDPILEVIK